MEESQRLSESTTQTHKGCPKAQFRRPRVSQAAPHNAHRHTNAASARRTRRTGAQMPKAAPHKAHRHTNAASCAAQCAPANKRNEGRAAQMQMQTPARCGADANI